MNVSSKTWEGFLIIAMISQSKKKTCTLYNMKLPQCTTTGNPRAKNDKAQDKNMRYHGFDVTVLHYHMS